MDIFVNVNFILTSAPWERFLVQKNIVKTDRTQFPKSTTQLDSGAWRFAKEGGPVEK